MNDYCANCEYADQCKNGYRGEEPYSKKHGNNDSGGDEMIVKIWLIKGGVRLW